MRPVVLTQTGIGPSSPVVMDRYISPSNISLYGVVNGTVNYVVESSPDDPFAPNYNPNSATWFIHPDFDNGGLGISTNAVSNYAFAPVVIRLRVVSGTGSVRLTITQSGIGGT